MSIVLARIIDKLRGSCVGHRYSMAVFAKKTIGGHQSLHFRRQFRNLVRSQHAIFNVPLGGSHSRIPTPRSLCLHSAFNTTVLYMYQTLPTKITSAPLDPS